MALLSILALDATAQLPTYKIDNDPNGTLGKDFVITVEWPSNSANTNVALDNAFVGVLYTEGTTLTRTNVSGSWTNSTSVPKATLNSVCGSSTNPDDFNFQHYNLPTQHIFGDRASGGSDTLFKLSSSTYLSAGKIQLLTNTNPPGTVEGCLYTNGAKNTGTIDPNFPSTSTGFDIAGTGGQLSLPVEMLTFDAEWKSEDALIKWSTASETNSAGFYVERSLDGTNFETVSDLIQSKSSNGFSSSVLNYQYFDYGVKPLVAKNVYYRLRQIDFDGATENHGPVVLSVQSAPGKIVIYPNPSSDEVNVRVTVSRAQTLKLQDMAGRVIMELNEKTHDDGWTFSVDHLDRGFYTVTIADDSRSQVTTRKIVVK